MAALVAAVSSYRSLCLVLLLYVCFINHFIKTSETAQSLIDGDTLYASRYVGEPKLDYGVSLKVSMLKRQHRQSFCKLGSFHSFKAGCVIGQRAAVVILLVCMSNDVASNPGPCLPSLSLKDLSKSRGLKIAHLNIRSIVNKMDSLKVIMKDNPLDIFTISETWLKPTISDNEVFLPGYSCVRNDRLNKVGGGTMIYIRDGIPYRSRMDLASEVCESCCIEIARPKCKTLLIWTAYRAPDVNLDLFIEDLNRSLLVLSDDVHTILLGDFNVDMQISKKISNKEQRRKLIKLTSFHNFEQEIITPTRVTQTSSTLIDLLFSNNPGRIVDKGVFPLSLSDHSLIYCVYKAGQFKSPGRIIEHRSFKHYSKSNFTNDLKSVDWSSVNTEEDLDQAVLKWNALFTTEMDKHAPIKKSRIRGISTPWMTAELSVLMQKRDFLHRKAIKSNLTNHWSHYKDLRNTVNREIRKHKAEHYSKLIEDNKNNSSVLWKTLNEITTRKQTSPVSCIEADGVIYSEPKSIAEILNQHFSTIGIKIANGLKSLSCTILNDESTNLSCTFAMQPISVQFVLNELLNLKSNKAVGMDKINARFLKDAAHVIAESLTNLLNRSIESSKFPSLWKFGKVTALFKSGNRCDPNNYRPITVLPTVSKILEKAVHCQLYDYLNVNKILTSNQFGFRPKLSTSIALAHFTDNILDEMDSGSLTGALFLDLSKAFDTINHSLLIKKLQSIGLQKSTIDWFQSYLAYRTQATIVSPEMSQVVPITVGVPQGSILGPLLFLIYVNNLTSCNLSSKIIFYADDTVIYYSSRNPSDINEILNSDLAIVTNWFNQNLLSLNTSKCKFLLFGSPQKLKKVDNISFKIGVNNDDFEKVESFKYLGVILHQHMTWDEHVDNIIKIINQRIGIIYRIKHLIPLNTRMVLYNSLILPLLDYGDLIWADKNNSTLMEHLQILQNKTAKIMLDLPPRSSATEALTRLKMKPLLDRRFFHRCYMVYKGLNKLIDYDFDLTSNTMFHSYDTRAKNDLHLPRIRTNWGKQRFVYHAASDWNRLDIDIRNSDSLAIFKSHF